MSKLQLLKTVEKTIKGKASEEEWAESAWSWKTKLELLNSQKKCFLLAINNSVSWYEYYQLFHSPESEDDRQENSRLIKEIRGRLNQLNKLTGKISSWEKLILNIEIEQFDLLPFCPLYHASSFLKKITETNHYRRMMQVRWGLVLNLVLSYLTQLIPKVEAEKKARLEAEKKARLEAEKARLEAEKKEKVEDNLMGINAENKVKYEQERIANSQKWDLNDPRQYQSYLAEERRISHEAYWNNPFN